MLLNHSNRKLIRNGEKMSGKVKKGQVTYDAEGNDIEKSPYFSRVIHWPGTALSGVTIGRGYDMGSRTKGAVKQDMIKVGIPSIKATALSEGAGKKGTKAEAFVTKNKKSIDKITIDQQVNLFNLIYPTYEARAKKNYNNWTSKEASRIEWEKLHDGIRDVLVDFVYQGFTKGPSPMKAGMNNSFDELIKYIQKNRVMTRYEKGRRRVQYLEIKKEALRTVPVKAMGIKPFGLQKIEAKNTAIENIGLKK